MEEMKQLSRKVLSRSACCLSAEVTVTDKNGPNAKTQPITIIARTTTPLTIPGLDAPLLQDFSALQQDREHIALDYGHDQREPLGYANHPRVVAGKLIYPATIVSTRPDDRAAKIMAQAAEGVPFQASLFWEGDLSYLPKGKSAVVNGTSFDGPMYVVNTPWSVRGIAICLYGMDSHTSTQWLSDKNATIEVAVKPYKQNTAVQKCIGDNVMSEQSVEATKAVETEKIEAAAESVETGVEAKAVVAEAEVKTPEVVEATEEAEVKTETVEVEKKLSEGERFLKAFGDIGGVYFAKEMTFGQAMEEHAKQLSQEIGTLRTENADLKTRLSAALAASQGVSAVSFSEQVEAPQEKKEIDAEIKRLTEDKGLTLRQAAMIAALRQQNNLKVK